MDQRGNADNPTPPGRRRPATSHAAQHLDLATLSAYVDRALGTADRRAVETHLAACAACRQELMEIGGTVELLRGLPRYQPRRSFRIDPAVARRQRGNVVWLGPYLSALPALRVATAAVALLFLGTIAADVMTNPNTPPGREVAVDQPVPTSSTDEDAGIAVATATPARTPEAAAEPAGGAEGIAETGRIEQGDDEAQEAAQEADTAAGAAANEAIQAESADSQTTQRQAPAPAPAGPTATTMPTATPIPTATAVPTPIPERPAATFAAGFPWLLVEILLGGLLIILATTLIMLRRLRQRLGPPPGPR